MSTISSVIGLEDRVRICIQRMGYPQLRSIDCQVNGDVVSLSGTLESFYMCQIAQEAASKTPGVRMVLNEIQVNEFAETSCAS